MASPTGALEFGLAPEVGDGRVSGNVSQEDAYVLLLTNSLCLISSSQQEREERHAAPRTEVIG